MPRRMAAGRSQDLLDAANTASGAWADTAYRSAANLAVLANRALVPHLQRPKPRGKPMLPHIRRGNATRGKVRAAVEHAFATQKQRLRLVVRTVGLARVTTKLGLAKSRLQPAPLHRAAKLEPRPHSTIGRRNRTASIARAP